MAEGRGVVKWAGVGPFNQDGVQCTGWGPEAWVVVRASMVADKLLDL